MIEWWASTAAGFEQGFEVGTWPGEEVVLHVGSSSVAVASGAELRLGSGSASAWRVSGLRAWDADGAELAAAMAPEEGGFRIAVNLVGARFPVTIDPLYTAEDSLDGSEADAALGQAISAGGDVNGDGYPDAVVGAPWSDVSAADGGVIYSFLGTSSGLGTSGMAFTQALGADAQLGAALSIDGDVTGDGCFRIAMTPTPPPSPAPPRCRRMVSIRTAMARIWASRTRATPPTRLRPPTPPVRATPPIRPTRATAPTPARPRPGTSAARRGRTPRAGRG